MLSEVFLPATRRLQAAASVLNCSAAALLATVVAGALIPYGQDFENYAAFFEIARFGGWGAAFDERFEPLFALAVIFLTQLTSTDLVVYGTLMFICLTAKFYAISRSSAHLPSILLISAFYLARFMPLHELTQLRIATSLAFLLLAAAVWNRPTFWITLAAGVLTHYSAIILVPVVVAWRTLNYSPMLYRRLETPVWMTAAALVAVAALALQAFLGPLSTAFIAINMYSDAGFGDDRVNLISLAVVADVALLASAWLVSWRDPRLRFWLLVQTLGLATFFALQDFPVLAHRLREAFSVFWIFYFAGAMTSRYLRGEHARVACFAMIPLYIYLHFLGSNALFPIR